MKYNPQNAREVAAKSKLESDEIYTCIVTKIEEGKVADFLSEEVKKVWQGDTEQDCINVHTQIKSKDDEEEFVDYSQIFTLNYGEDGAVEYNSKSNLGKYVVKYKHLPQIGDMIKVATNGEGKPKLKLD